MKKLRILFIVRSYPSSKKPISGIFIKEHAKAVSLYEEVAVITSEYDSGLKSVYKIDTNMEEEIQVLRVSYRKSPIPKTTYFIYLWGIFCAFRRLIKENWIPDIIHAHIYSEGVPAVMLGKYYKKPVVISEHFSSFPRKTIRGFEKLKAIFSMNNSNVIISVSRNLIKYIKYYGVKNQFKVVPNTFDTNVFFPDIKRKPRETKKLLLVASLIPIKGIPYLLESLMTLEKNRNDFILDIVGAGPCKIQYEKYSCELGIKDKVNFHGLKKKEEIARFMRNADVFVLSSIWENLPCVLIEAMACGLPIIATKIGGIPEIMNEKTGIMVPPKNKDALADAILYVFDHIRDYSREEIAEYAKRNFSFKVIGKQLDNIYNGILHNK
jgi:glycosyltransferase involved in cell wall biosynthesis